MHSWRSSKGDTWAQSLNFLFSGGSKMVLEPTLEQGGNLSSESLANGKSIRGNTVNIFSSRTDSEWGAAGLRTIEWKNFCCWSGVPQWGGDRLGWEDKFNKTTSTRLEQWEAYPEPTLTSPWTFPYSPLELRTWLPQHCHSTVIGFLGAAHQSMECRKEGQKLLGPNLTKKIPLPSQRWGIRPNRCFNFF